MQAVRQVYDELWAVIALYEPTECYNERSEQLFLGEEKLAGMYEGVYSGSSTLTLPFYPNEKLFCERNAYFAEIKRKNKDSNLEISKERIFQSELHQTPTVVF